jgi:hypothetical protein
MQAASRRSSRQWNRLMRVFHLPIHLWHMLLHVPSSWSLISASWRRRDLRGYDGCQSAGTWSWEWNWEQSGQAFNKSTTSAKYTPNYLINKKHNGKFTRINDSVRLVHQLFIQYEYTFHNLHSTSNLQLPKQWNNDYKNKLHQAMPDIKPPKIH